MTSLHVNQQNAIKTTIRNDFSSGVHAHATGTGKSWIALQLLIEFVTRYPAANVLWICEQKSILQEQFNAAVIKAKGFSEIKRRFMILDFSTRKSSSWTEEIQMATIWRRPMLVVINRAFLVSLDRYKALRTHFGLIIHDECHSIVNSTTRAFYEWALNKWTGVSCIGFSATPVLTYEPFKRILSQYSIYDAVCDGTILSPKIMWLKSENHITYDTIISIVQRQLDDLPYKKILVWCGLIDHCNELYERWSGGLLKAIDTSVRQENLDEFMAATENAIMFCAAKHREGSDIKNLDCCVFMDAVEDRAAKVFVQCVGRVLRRDPAGKKKYGLIIDASALSSIKICDRINQFMGTSDKTSFPFTYDNETVRIESGDIKLHTLTMLASSESKAKFVLHVPPSIKVFFVRPLPEGEIAASRLEYEIDMISRKNLMQYLMQAIEVLKITKGIPHVTRGSCGSSLLCYMLGISHVDPVAYNISFARFLTDFRSTLPDIDFDFPYNMRDEVFLQLELRWPGAVARISNHVFYHKKSALREAVRRIGIKKQIRVGEMYGLLRSLKTRERRIVETTSKSLENTFRTYSLHCGGVVFFPEGVPSDLLLRGKKGTLAQITLNKHDVANNKNFKIDILSSRALAQLYEANRFETIAFENCPFDDAVADLFCHGDNIGITLAESPLCRKAFMKFRPRSVDDIALCLAIIRPAARAARTAKTMKDMETHCVYDDDAISFISMAFSCDEEKADYYRRGLIKGDATIKGEFMEALSKISAGARNTLTIALKNMRAYSFCKSHAYSYAQLVWKLGWMKVYRPAEFWSAALKHCHSSYRRWVLLYEAHLAGVRISGTKQVSIYADRRRHNMVPKAGESPEESLRRIGYWDFNGPMPESYYYPGTKSGTFRGLIASSRYLNYDSDIKTAVLFVCVKPRKFIEVIISGRRLSLHGKIGLQGIGTLVEDGVYEANEGNYVLY